jgi:hypothetical protein
MKTTTKKILIIALSIVILGFIIYKLSVLKTDSTIPIDSNGQITTEESILGCYVATLGQDIYSLDILFQDDQVIGGNLVFDNFDKDSSSGSFAGTYREGILFGDYSFQSEGMNSEMQVIFKRTENGFVRGYGEVDLESGTTFSNLDEINFDDGYEFVYTEAECATPYPRLNLE